jgi:hypothetical protein
MEKDTQFNFFFKYFLNIKAYKPQWIISTTYAYNKSS